MRIIKVLSMTALLLALQHNALGAKLRVPAGMGGVADIGAIPCSVFNEMLVIGPKGTRLSLLTWANGFLYAKHGKTLDELADAAAAEGEVWEFDRLTDHLVDFCAANPEAVTRDAVIDLDRVF